MLSLLFATAIGVLKVAHDSGRSKTYFILAMAISVFTVSNDWIVSALFMLPLIPYVMETGDLHKVNKINSPRLDWNNYIYAQALAFSFTLPFLYTHYRYAPLLILWPLLLRNLTWTSKPERADWWWICTFTLFFSYSLLYFLSL